VYYAIKPSDLGPHSIEQLAIFVTFCECYLGCRPYFPLWLELFHGRIGREASSGLMLAAGGVTFQLKPKANFVKLLLPKKAASEWKKSWFYVKEATPSGEVSLPEFVAERSEPRRLAPKMLPEDQRMAVAGMMDQIQKLKDQGLIPINLYNCWLGRRLVPLAARPHWMYEYSKKHDPSRTSKESWEAEDYKAALKKITDAEFTGAAVGVAPYTPVKNKAPIVSSLSNHCVSTSISVFSLGVS
jgi:hypothetical protein